MAGSSRLSSHLRRRALRGIAGIVAAARAPGLLAQQRILIGQSAPLSGQNAEFGKAIVAGARAWFGRYGKAPAPTVDHVVLDDGNDAARAATNAQLLIGRGATALFGYASATLSLPALPWAKQAGIPFFAPFTGASVIHAVNDPIVFTARASYAQEADKFCDALAGFGSKRIAVVHYADRVGNENRDVVAGAIDRHRMAAGPMVGIERNKAVGDDTIGNLVAQKPDAVLFTVLAAPTAQMVSRARAMGLSRSVFLVTLSFVGPSQLYRMLGDEGRGIVVSHVVPKPWAQLDIAREHAQAMRTAAAGEEPSFASLEAYIAARALTAGIDRARGTRPEALIAALETLNVDLGGYRLRYSRTQRHGSTYVDYTVIGQDFVR